VVIVFIGLGWGLLTMQIILLLYQLMKVKLLSSGRDLFLTSSVATILVIMVGVVFARRRVVFFAFIGFDAVSTAAQEAKNPQRNANWYFRFINNCTILYVLFAYVLTGLENYLNFKGDASPVTTAFAKRLHF
jgi:APA family basic amino acid/polyamine antiporter